MSELSETHVESQTQPDDEEPDDYRHYFGFISRQMSINGITAYVEGSRSMEEPDDRNIAMVWLLDDVQAIDRLVEVEHRDAKIHGALMRASTEMWAHMFMQPYREQRPVRLRGLDQSEISTA